MDTILCQSFRLLGLFLLLLQAISPVKAGGVSNGPRLYINFDEPTKGKKTELNTTDWVIIGSTIASAVVVIIVTVVDRMYRVRQAKKQEEQEQQTEMATQNEDHHNEQPHPSYRF